MPKHVMQHKQKMARAASPKSKSALDYPASSVGQTANVVVMLADALAGQGGALAKAVLAGVQSDYDALKALFGSLSTSNMTAVISPLSTGNDGTGGAYHYSCSDTTLYLDADLADGEPTGSQTTLALFVAEAVECFSAVQGKGWDCGSSNGEGLSRVLAEQLHPGILDGYETASAWLDGGRPDFVSQTDPTDQNAISTGCAVLFLWWLVSKGYSWQQVIAAGGSTLAQTYQALTGAASAWNDFSAACAAIWPVGQPSGVTTDNPWNAAPPPSPAPAPAPSPSPSPSPNPAPSPSPSPAPAPVPGQTAEQFVQALIDQAFQTAESGVTDPVELTVLQLANNFIDGLLPFVFGDISNLVARWQLHASGDPLESLFVPKVSQRIEAALGSHPLLQLLQRGVPVAHVQQLHAANLSGGLLAAILQAVVQYGPGILQLVLGVIGAVKGGSAPAA